ncbi:MAG: arginine--tRNA ligase [Pseudomonadota bacterium]
MTAPAEARDFRAALIAEISAPIVAFLAEQGVSEPPALAAPTVEGPDLAMPCHRYAKALRKAPQQIAVAIGEIAAAHPLVAKAEAANGFLNLSFSWPAVAARVVAFAEADPAALGHSDLLAGQKVVIEYSSPNTNKPQHLGHCRNNLLGQTIANLLARAGAAVTRLNLVNDRGIHICKSMLAYQRSGGGQTPETAGIKGDHLVGKFYVEFDRQFSAEYKAAFPNGDGPEKDAWFNGDSPLGQQTRALLRAWEAGDPEVVALWRMMNGWCEQGFAETYARMGVGFDRIERESEIYQLGKKIVEDGLNDGVFYKLPDGAVAFDQTKIGLEGKKVVLRGDGTSLYITQDLGTAAMRHDKDQFDRAIYVVGNEQDHYFKVLFGVLGELRPALRGRLTHRSYGMVELPDGRMKSREGTVVDADDLMSDLHSLVAEASAERWAVLEAAEASRRAEAIGLAGLKFFLLKFNPERTFIFDKQNSIAIEGETGPYCQYAHARATSLLTKAGAPTAAPDWAALDNPPARGLMTALMSFPGAVQRGALQLDPSHLTGALYDVAKAFSSFYNSADGRVIGAEAGALAARVALVRATRKVLAEGLGLLGITALDEM